MPISILGSLSMYCKVKYDTWYQHEACIACITSMSCRACSSFSVSNSWSSCIMSNVTLVTVRNSSGVLRYPPLHSGRTYGMRVCRVQSVQSSSPHSHSHSSISLSHEFVLFHFLDSRASTLSLSRAMRQLVNHKSYVRTCSMISVHKIQYSYIL